MAPVHFGRYRFAAALSQGRRVLDLACGEGYGVDLLAAAGASEVVGIDIEADVVRAARARYGRKGLTFRVADALATGEPAASFDVVVSLETIEHVESGPALVAEIARLLRPGGVCVLSTPNRLATGQHNPYHVREYSLPELESMLAGSFVVEGRYAQVPLTPGVRLLRTAYGLAEPLGLVAPLRRVFGLVTGGERWRRRPVEPTRLSASYRPDGPAQPLYFVLVARRRADTADR